MPNGGNVKGGGRPPAGNARIVRAASDNLEGHELGWRTLVSGVFFALTTEFNADELNVVLASGQATVYHRIVMASKDGDWIIRETPHACRGVLDALATHGAHYRPMSAPLDPRWLAGGWSSHLQFEMTPHQADVQPYLIRCDFVSRPPRIAEDQIPRIFEKAHRSGAIAVVDLESLIWLKQTRREKDYPIIGEIARRLPPELEILYSQDSSRVIELAPRYPNVSRPCVQAALRGEGNRAVGLAIYAERLDLIEADENRVRAYFAAGREYFRAVQVAGAPSMPLQEAHEKAIEIAERLLPERVPGTGG